MVLLIHMGGLGDICLSESTFLSLYRHFGKTIHAVGRKAVLEQFEEYFCRTSSIDRREWMNIFLDRPVLSPDWTEIVLIGKDSSGSLRKGLVSAAREPIFIDMYPDGREIHVEEYQLGQLGRYGIRAEVREPGRAAADRVILYPEKTYKKRKWPVERFIELYEKLKGRDRNVVLMRPPELDLPLPRACVFETLKDIALFFSAGGLFVSNDSGMAHFAARSGLATITLFYDTNPLIWHPKGSRYIRCSDDSPTVDEVLHSIEIMG